MDLKKYKIKTNSSTDIEAEEIFLDAEAIRSIEEKGKLEKPIKSRNFILFYLIILVILLGLGFRAGHLQIVKGQYYRDLADGNRMRTFYLPAPRGIIYDRNYDSLVYNLPSFDLTVNLADWLANEADFQLSVLQKISAIIDKPVSQLDQVVEKARGKIAQVNLEEGIEYSKALVLKALVGDWPGLRLQENAIRNYKSSLYFSHLLGYTGRVTQDDLKKNPGYFFNEYIGKEGLEIQYESILRGQFGQEQFEVDSLGRLKELLATKQPQPGQGLVLHIDAGLQEKAYQVLEEAIKKAGAKKGAVVAIDPRTGGVLALVSYPSFDNNLFNQAFSKKDYQELISNPSQPLFNRAIAGQYPPGSTFKPFVAVAALEENIVKANRVFNCQGALAIVNQYNPAISYIYRDWTTHGSTDLRKAIAESCNVYFYTVGGGYGEFKGLGIDRIKKYAQLFGLGQLTGIDLPVERAGRLPDPAWKKETKDGEAWYIGDTYNTSIGQGDVLATPLQMALSTATIANKGILYQPQILDKIVNPNRDLIKDIEPVIINQSFINQANLEIVREGMAQAVTQGSAWVLRGLNVSAGAKTGTAQSGLGRTPHAWFTCFAPYDQSEIAMAVMIEEGQEGSSVAGPVAAEILKWYFKQDLPEE